MALAVGWQRAAKCTATFAAGGALSLGDRIEGTNAGSSIAPRIRRKHRSQIYKVLFREATRSQLPHQIGDLLAPRAAMRTWRDASQHRSIKKWSHLR
jgi:hypothetical protein